MYPQSPSGIVLVHPLKESIEIQNLNYNEPCLATSISNEPVDKQLAPARTVYSNQSKYALVKYSHKEDVLSMFVVQDWGKTPPPSLKTSSSHQVREVQQVPVSEPAQKPVLIIVSKHEFDAVLLKKKKYYSETEVALPTDGQQDLSCKLEICVYDLEMNNQMMDYLSNKNEGDPHVFVTWNFVGLEQRTVSMPADQAHFHTNVTYFGPLSDNLTKNVQERDMPIYLMLEMSDGQAAKVGEGHLDLSPAIQHPGRSYLRCVNLSGDGGSANVYCSFKLHECCQSDAPAGFMLEVGIGHLRLNNSDIASNPQATHLYVEYLLLGHCGEELETDSVPKSEVMRFNHTKRMRITDQNCVHLQPYLQEDDTKSLRFNVLAEPCSLANDSEINEVGYADLNLLEEMVLKNRDVISAQVPVFDSNGQNLGSLSVTVIGIDTLQNYAEHQGS